MATNIAWNLGEVPDDARDAALRCALREGVPVGEWMTRQILKGFSELKVRDQVQMLDELSAQVSDLARRFDHVADQSETEGLREAVKRLHQGLARIASEVGEQTSGNAAQVSKLADSLDVLTSQFESLRSETVGARNGLDARLTQTAGQLTIQISSLASNLEALAEKLGSAQNDAAGISMRMEQRLSQAQSVYDSAFTRHNEETRAIASDLAELTCRVEESRSRATDTVEGLDRRLAVLKEELADLNARQNGASQSISTEFEALKAGLIEARANAMEKSEALEHRFEGALQDIRNLEAGYSSAHRELVERLEKLGEEGAGSAAEAARSVDALRSDAAERDEVLRRRLAVVDCAFADLSQRQTDATKSHEERFDLVLREVQDAKSAHGDAYQRLAERLEQIQSDAEQAASTLAESFSARGHEVEALGARHNEAIQTLEQRIDALHGTFSEREQGWAEQFAGVDRNVAAAAEHLESEFQQVRSYAEQSIATLDQQLKDIRRSFDERDVHENCAKQELFGKLDNAVAQLSGASAAFDRQLAAIKEQIEQQNSRQEKTAETLAGLQQREAAISASIAELTDKFADIQQKFDVPRTEQHLAAIARSAAELVGRQSVEDAVQAIDGKLQFLETSQREALSEFKAELLDAAVAAMNERLEAGEKRLAEAIESMKAQPALSSAPQPQSHETVKPTEFDAPPFVGPPPFAPAHIDGHGDVPPSPDAPVVFPPLHDDHQSAQAGLLDPVPSAVESASSITEHDVPSAHSFISAARRSAQANAAQETAVSKAGGIDGFLGKWAAKPQNKIIAGIAACALIVVATHLWLQRSLTQPSTSTRAPISAHKVASNARATKTIHQKSAAVSQPLLPISQHVSTPSAAPQTTQVQKPEVAATQSGTVSSAGIVQLADAGNARAELMLGLRAFADKQNPASAAEAAKWLSRAAKQGDAIAQYHLGMLYQQGRGAPADTSKAFAFYEAAANAGNRDAMNNLGVAYAQGTGTAKDFAKAVRWFSTAAKLGLVEAQFDLAVLYERGEGIPQSLANAYRWYAIAAKEGDEGSKARADALATQISPQDRAAADEFAAEFKPAPIDPQANIAPPLSGTANN